METELLVSNAEFFLFDDGGKKYDKLAHKLFFLLPPPFRDFPLLLQKEKRAFKRRLNYLLWDLKHRGGGRDEGGGIMAGELICVKHCFFLPFFSLSSSGNVLQR